MPRMLSGLCAATATLVLLMAGVADASTTLGSTSIPSGGSGNHCNTDSVFSQATSDPATPFTVPGPGTLTQWQVNTIDAAPNAPLTFVVLKVGAGSATVVGVDSRTLPSSLPPGDHVVSFTPPAPIAVTGGETLALYTNASNVYCEWSGGLPDADTLAAHLAPTPPAPGQSLTFFQQSGSGYRMNLAATYEPPAPAKKKCKKHKKKRSAGSAKKKKCKKKKKR